MTSPFPSTGEDEAAEVDPAGPAEPAEAVAGGEAASVDPGAQVQGEANVAMIDAARERAENQRASAKEAGSAGQCTRGDSTGTSLMGLLGCPRLGPWM